jgi:DNA-binding transcriptional MerR regulator
LSAKALRLYDQLGLLTPSRTDTSSGYRFYAAEQIPTAQLVGLLRRIDMPLALIASVINTDAESATQLVTEYWTRVETTVGERRQLTNYIHHRLTGVKPTMTVSTFQIETRTVPARTVLSISRHVHIHETAEFFADAFARLRSAAPGITGIAGIPYVVYYGEVSVDSDGPIELCRPIATADLASGRGADIEQRLEAEHEEVFIRLAMRDIGWPAMLPGVDALEAWIRDHERQPGGPLRQVLIGDQRTATPDTPVCDLTIPLRPPPS